MPGQSRPGSNGNEGVLRIPQGPSITGTSPSDCLVSYQDTRRGSYPSAEVQSVYSTDQAGWAKINLKGLIIVGFSSFLLASFQTSFKYMVFSLKYD